MALKDYIKDITTYVNSTGFFDKIKVNANQVEISTEAVHKDKEVILKGKSLKPIKDFEGEFGLSNLSLLQTITSDPEYSFPETNAAIKYETRNAEKVPTELIYQNRSKSFINYRFMSKGLIPEQPRFNEPNWDISIKPTKSNIQQLGWAVAGLSLYEQYFTPKIVDNELKFFIGEDDAAVQRGGVVFASNLTATFDEKFKWNVQHILTVLKKAESTDCEMQFSTKGAICITLNTGIGIYKYIFPAKVR